MKEKVKRVMEYIHNIASINLQSCQYTDFLEEIQYEIDKELDEFILSETEE